ncbi:MAG: hypothetical protein ACK4K7_00355 [Allosphingosinicella sp.]|uniref:hypothetical protein n=1 Tax=Allosphingosinicella sp. TaxID=2823234 RepID=UPI0039528B08
MKLALLAGSLVAVLALAAVAWLLGLGGGAIGDEAEAMRIAEEDLGGFRAERAFLSADGTAALVLGAGGAAAVLKQHGTRPAVRRLPELRAAPDPQGIRIATGERMFGDVLLKLDAAERDRLLTLV